MSKLFTALSAYAAIRAAFSTDMPHLLAYSVLCAMALYLAATGVNADCDNAD